MKGIDFIVLFFLVAVTACVVPVTDRLDDLETQMLEREVRLNSLGK